MVSGVRVVRRRLFSELEARAAMAKRIRIARKAENYPLIQGELDDAVQNELRARRAGGRVSFLDAGAGLGRGVLDALRFGVDAYGLAPHPPFPSWLASGRMAESVRRVYRSRVKGRWINAPFESVVMPEAFDVIQSRFGLVHASNHALALENLLNSLKPGGVLLIRGIEYGGSLRVFGKVPIEKLHEHARLLAGGADLDALEEIEHEHPELEWLRVAETLERQGFIAPGLIGKTRFSVVPIRFRIERLGIRKADLSEFYGHPNNRVPIRRASSRA